MEFDHVDKRPTKPATPGDRRASEALPIFEGSEVHTTVRHALYLFMVGFHVVQQYDTRVVEFTPLFIVNTTRTSPIATLVVAMTRFTGICLYHILYSNQ